jgi:nucleotide-binding universal stress UspA family protein
MYDTILVAVDSSEESRAALEHAVALAAAVGATVHRISRRMPRALTPWRKPTLDDANNGQQQDRLPHYCINIHQVITLNVNYDGR